MFESDYSISIVIATYNKKVYLERTLFNLNKQTNINFEIIVVNDGSSDETRDFLNHIKTAYSLKIIHNDSNLGLAKSRNIGINKSTGSYILFLDDDIILNDRYIERLYHDLKIYPTRIHAGNLYKINIDFVLELFKNDTLHIRIDEKVIENINIDPIYEPLKIIGKNNNIDTIACWWGLVTGANICISKAQVIKIGMFDENFVTWGPEDVDLCYRAFNNGIKLAYHDENKLFHLDHNRDSTMMRNAMIKNAIKLVKKYNKTPEIEAYIKFFNGTISLNNFNDICSKQYNYPAINIEDYYVELKQYIKSSQIIKSTNNDRL
ncbi:MAG: glycosyltransferase [Dysgonamonadaceae bacterium]|jgi:GT2 family glycosyltransferase|nr:glycosyltransferase [Dysgonamonadaceae bacterium]